MARIGINPARGKVSSYHPARISVTVLTYLPDLTGYFEKRLDVLKLTFASLRAHTPLPHDLLVFDNGSCRQVVDYLRSLQDLGQINVLMLSKENVGKIGALRLLFEAAPGEIIAYNDDDILFYPGWLGAHLEILENFPDVGMVSGLPVRDASNHARASLERLARQGSLPGLSVSRERRIPDEWEVDWALSTGRDAQAHLAATKEHQDLVFRLQVTGEQGFIEAIASANHFQFVAPRQVILQALPGEWSGKLMGHMIELDEAVDRQGCLRLSTTRRYTRHLGNALSDEVTQEAGRMGLISAGEIHAGALTKSRPSTRDKHWLLRLPGSRRLLAGLYHRLFNLLYK
jgi:hypothetical protein